MYYIYFGISFFYAIENDYNGNLAFGHSEYVVIFSMRILMICFANKRFFTASANIYSIEHRVYICVYVQYVASSKIGLFSNLADSKDSKDSNSAWNHCDLVDKCHKLFCFFFSLYVRNGICAMRFIYIIHSYKSFCYDDYYVCCYSYIHCIQFFLYGIRVSYVLSKLNWWMDVIKCSAKTWTKPINSIHFCVSVFFHVSNKLTRFHAACQ